jgi:hypothetical protein
MDVLIQLGGLVLVFLAGVGFACHRLKGSLKMRPTAPPATTVQAITKAFGGGGGGPIEPF